MDVGHPQPASYRQPRPQPPAVHSIPSIDGAQGTASLHGLLPNNQENEAWQARVSLPSGVCMPR